MKKLIEKHGYRLNFAGLYYWPSNDDVGKGLVDAIKINPFFAEGLIFSIVPVNSGCIDEVSGSCVDRKQKIAFFAGDEDNFNFLWDVIEHYRRGGHDVRVVNSIGLTVDELSQHLQWSDVSWFEWGNGPVIPATHLPKSCKIVVRIHRYEVFSDEPKRINWSNVDELIFVSDYVYGLFRERHFDNIAEITNVSVVSNAIDLEKYRLSRKERGYNIAYVNRIHRDKNPQLMLQIVSELVKREPRFKCYVAGAVKDEVIFRYLKHMIRAMNLESHIEFCGFVEDMDAWLEDKHYLLSTSLVEGHPVSVLEGMAKGLKPVIHNYLGHPSSFLGEEFVFQELRRITGK